MNGLKSPDELAIQGAFLLSATAYHRRLSAGYWVAVHWQEQEAMAAVIN